MLCVFEEVHNVKNLKLENPLVFEVELPQTPVVDSSLVVGRTTYHVVRQRMCFKEDGGKVVFQYCQIYMVRA